MEVQEVERRNIARELHDEIGQVLTGLKLTLEMGNRVADEIPTCLNKARMLVNELMARARKLSLDLRPAMLDDLGLLPALLWHIEHYSASTHVHVNFKHSGLEGRRFAPEVRLGLSNRAGSTHQYSASCQYIRSNRTTPDASSNALDRDSGSGDRI